MHAVQRAEWTADSGQALVEAFNAAALSVIRRIDGPRDPRDLRTRARPAQPARTRPRRRNRHSRRRLPPRLTPHARPHATHGPHVPNVHTGVPSGKLGAREGAQRANQQVRRGSAASGPATRVRTTRTPRQRHEHHRRPAPPHPPAHARPRRRPRLPGARWPRLRATAIFLGDRPYLVTVGLRRPHHRHRTLRTRLARPDVPRLARP
ncbi:hypothetical protein ACU686_37445 [Yinghuangia aomiensis]